MSCILRHWANYIKLLQLLMFVRGLKYEEKSLSSKYRKFTFPLRDFLNYMGNSRPVNNYQVSKLKEFFNLLQTKFVLESFQSDCYRSLVSIPETKVYKSSKDNNMWFAEVWIADELFEYLCPFLCRDYFKDNLKKHEFGILFEIWKVLNSPTSRKIFNIRKFLEAEQTLANGRRRKEIKEYFIQIFNQLHESGRRSILSFVEYSFKSK